MNKIVINNCYGGFSLSDKACKMLAESFNLDEYDLAYGRGIPRHDPRLIEVVEALGEDANGTCAELFVDEIEGNLYRISEYDGKERIVEPEDQEWIHID